MAVRKTKGAALQLVRDSEQLERQLAEAQALAQIGSWEWDLATDQVTWSAELYRLHGVDPRAFHPTLANVLALQHPEDVARVRDAIDRSLRDHVPYAVEHRVIRPDGAIRVWQSRGAVVLDRSGRPVKMHGTGQDITERRQAEAALRDAEAKYRTLFENAVEGIFRTTPDGRFVMANEALARMLGYDTPAQLIRERTALETQHYVRPAERARFRRLLETQGVVRGFEYEAYRRDGTKVWLRDHVRLVHDAGGGVLYEGTVEDVTNRRRADALLDLRARQQAAVAQLGQTAISGRPIPELFDCAVQLVADTLDVGFASVLEHQPQGRLRLVAGVGWDAGVLGREFAGGDQTLAGRTLAGHEPVVVTDWAEHPFSRSAHLRAHGIRSSMAVIIGALERPYGVLAAHAADRREFGGNDVNFIQSIAHLLASAIARRRAEEVRSHLLARAISAQEEERTRVARELHDETGQSLSAILVGLRNLEEAPDLAVARDLVARLRDLASESIRNVGRIARGLRPSTLDDLGLVPALQRYAEELNVTRGIDITIAGDRASRLPPKVETTLYRIVQEALTNVARHAGARSARVTIVRGARTVGVTVCDDGRGFDVAAALHLDAKRRALGLIGMQERASLLGGRVEIISQPKRRGTEIVVELPLEP